MIAKSREDLFGPGRPWRSFSRYLREEFGRPVRRITLDAGFTCPNVDGTVAKGGCVYCDNRSFSPNRRLPRTSIREQVRRGAELLQRRYGTEVFLAYFQAATNTYAPVPRLRSLYDEALEHPQVVGLALGTRPDCLGEDVLDLLAEYGSQRHVRLEIGLQSMHERSLAWMNRGHGLDAFLDAVRRCASRPLHLSVHVILGLPGESRADMLATADLLAGLPVHAVKIHNLHVVRGTPLEDMHRRGLAPMLEFDEYVALACDFLERLPPEMVVERLHGDAPPDWLVAPLWCLDRQALLRAVEAEFLARGSHQGMRFAKTSTPHQHRPARIGLDLV